MKFEEKGFLFRCSSIRPEFGTEEAIGRYDILVSIAVPVSQRVYHDQKTFICKRALMGQQ